MSINNFLFFALAPTGYGISGSDRIFIELAREWSKKSLVKIFTTHEGIEMMNRQKLSGKFLEIVRIENNRLPKNVFIKYLYKILLGIKLGITYSPNTQNSQQTTFIYSSSDFWMDIFPAVLLKLRFSNLKWVATWFQTAPNPLSGYRVKGKRKNIYFVSALIYWFSQLVVKPLINKFADKIIVNNEEEVKRFPDQEKHRDLIVILGAVPIKEIDKWKSKIGVLPKVYDAVFQGRFHPQKGVVELVDIWRKVVDKVPKVKLVMIGDGPLYKDVELRIKNLGLEKNVKLVGYLFDGAEKFKIFSQSKIVIHPAFYDSGGMAAAEAMAFGLPAVGFDLNSYKSYYPEGMLKIPLGNLDEFALELVDLLKDKKKRLRLGELAKNTIENNWSWEERANQIFQKVTN